MGKEIVFRCKTSKGNFEINHLKCSDTCGQLLNELIKSSNISRDNIRVLCGFPPKEVDLIKNIDQPLKKLFKSLKELLIVSESRKVESPHECIPAACVSSIGYEIPFSSISGQIKRKIVPANNSCLFTAVFYCVSRGKYDLNVNDRLRKIIALKVREDPILFNDAILGCPSEEYIPKILKNDTWGGSIELSILSEHYGIEIVAVDTQNVRLNRFGEDRDYKNRIFLIYDGVHYDALYFEFYDPKTKEMRIETIFSTEFDEPLTFALDFAKDAMLKGQFTDLKNFKLKCLACGERFIGPKEAEEHAKNSGHQNFDEF